MLFTALFLLLPAVSLARIKIRINAGMDEQNASVEYVGAAVDIISDKERETFGIGDEPLKDAVKSFSGGRPQGVYVRSPTPWGDLYSKYKWPQIRRTLYPVKGTIRGISSKPVIVATREFINNGTVNATYNTDVIQSDMEHAFSRTWNRSHELTVGQNIFYSIEFKSGEVGSAMSFSYAYPWGQNTTKSESYKVSYSNPVILNMEPGQSVVATLTASNCTMEVEMEYRATLDGFVVCNYPGRHQGHYFWGYDIDGVLFAAGKEKIKTSKEVIKIGFYSNVKLVLSDTKFEKNVA